MYCMKCGTQLPDNAQFCEKCGSPVSNTNEQREKDSPTVHVNDRKSNIKSGYHKLLGDDFVPNAAEEAPVRYPHPYHQLGGWLGFITYACLVIISLMGILMVVSLVQVFRVIKYLGGYGAWLTIVYLIVVACFAYSLYFAMRFFKMVKEKDPRFLRFYELVSMFCIVIYLVLLILTGFRNVADTIENMLTQALAFAIWTTYFRKSVRVRTYFGSDEYLKRSIFFKNCTAPQPADLQPYSAQPQQTSAVPQPQSDFQSQNAVSGATDAVGGSGFCTGCGAQLKENATFCTVCGKKTDSGETKCASETTSENKESPDHVTQTPD